MSNNIFIGNGGIKPKITIIIDSLLRKKKDFITYADIITVSNPQNDKERQAHVDATKNAISAMKRELGKRGYKFVYANGRDAKKGFRYPDECQDPLKDLRENGIKITKQYLLDFCSSSIHMLPKVWTDKLLPQVLIENNDSSSPIIECDSNAYLQNISLLPILYNHIKNKDVITFYYNAGYHENKPLIFHPQYLKEYNNRWFLFGQSEDDKGKVIETANCPLDRINADSLRIVSDRNYISAEPSFYTNYFKDKVGVTHIKGSEPITIKIETLDSKVHGLILSKPIHSSQKEIKKGSSDKCVVISKRISW